MAISVVGFDLGYQSCYVSVARGGGIETVANEYSDRNTPTCISFGPNSRFIGAAAKQQQVTNITNTIYGFTKLIGRQFSDKFVQDEIRRLPYKIVCQGNDQIGIHVNYLGEEQIFSPQQLVAMQLVKLKEVAEKNLKSKVVDIVLNVPSSATDIERRAYLDATQIAGLNCIRLINDTTAVGVAYGIYNKDLPAANEASRNVAFIDFGASNFQVSIIAFNDGKMKVLSTVSDSQLGGRDFDEVIFKRMSEECNAKYKLDVAQSAKATLRLLQECEKLKKLMSANSMKIPLNIECFMNDKDISLSMDRAEFESLSTSLFNRIESILNQAFTQSNLSDKNDIHIVEIVGGSSRMPYFKTMVQNLFLREPRTTLNADEAVARGASLQCAILSPAFRVREFNISDICSYGISLMYQEPGKQDPILMELFPHGHIFPATKQFALSRSQEFSLNVLYTDPMKIPHSNKGIGTFSILNVVPQSDGEPSKVKIKVRVNVHGIFNISQAQLTEKVEKIVTVEEPVVPEANKDISMENKSDKTNDNANFDSSDGKADSKVPPEDAVTTEPSKANEDDHLVNGMQVDAPVKKEPVTKTKIVNKYTDLNISANIFFANDRQFVLEAMERENKFQAQDKLECDRMAAKNSVEEYVYEMRDKLSGQFETFASDAEKESFSSELSRTEEWLYEEGADLNKQSYVDRLAALQSVGEKIRARAVEAELRPKMLDEFGRLIVNVGKAIESYNLKEETYNHIDPVNIQKLATELEIKQKWFTHEIQIQNIKKTFEDPSLTVDKIRTQFQALDALARTTLNVPKPKVEPPPVDEKLPEPPQNNTQSNGVNADMDID